MSSIHVVDAGLLQLLGTFLVIDLEQTDVDRRG
jgi:hypothetical protein